MGLVGRVRDLLGSALVLAGGTILGIKRAPVPEPWEEDAPVGDYPSIQGLDGAMPVIITPEARAMIAKPIAIEHVDMVEEPPLEGSRRARRLAAGG